MNLNQHLESKTNGGLILILSVVVLLALINRLTADVIELIKWLGSSFFAVRTMANYAENKFKPDA